MITPLALCCRLCVFAACWLALLSAQAETKESLRLVGVAKIDITPNYPIRLNGYLGRNVEATNAVQHLFAKALAIGSDKDQPALLITIDNCILPSMVREQLVQRLQTKARIAPERIALCVSHTHTGPCLTGAAPNLFGMPIPAIDQAHIDRYTSELIDNLEKVCLAALKDRRPAQLAWGQDKADFAANRRTPGGPVDHDLPFLIVTDPKGNLRAVLANYACHCTTLGGNFTQICGDWAGYAQEYLEHDHPGAIAMMAIGCAADANPSPRTGLEFAQKHGREIAEAVNQALNFTRTPLSGKLECRTKEIELAFDKLPTREQWESLAKQTNAIGYHARKNLARLDRGEQLETKIPYLVQTWNFGNDLAMVFLSGEVVVDYSLRLKKEFDATRLWVNAYANDVPGYIPSERILKEGGYEGGGAMIYYDHPTRFAPGLEERIVATVRELMPADFVFDAQKAEFPPPKSPQESLAAMKTRHGLQIELVASEPLIVDPVAIDWGPDGKLWVVEMRDYPMGMDGNWKPGGRIKYLESTRGDGKYDKATVVLDNIPFPTGVMAWRNGAFVCAAPDILFVESTVRNGSPASAKKLLTGFFTDNYQARVNGLSYGLDNWIYGANGLLGGVIRGMSNGREVDIRGRDFRMNPDTGVFEPVAGLTQQGRVRNDWGDWFGCDNSNPIWHYPLPDHYVRRNPFVTAPSPRVYAATGPEPDLVHPISRLLERFNNPESANRVTSGCGLGIDRDEVLGQEFYGNAFVCEPVHNLVHRMRLEANGATFNAVRADDEQNSEFLASRDNWFRPVQVRTGPDGAIYVVDMYRFVIEHPRWIPPERLAKLDVRAGADKGRIYRVIPAGGKLRAVPNLRKLSTPKLVAALGTPNGTERDLIQIELVQRNNQSAIKPLAELAQISRLPAVRVQALCTLDGLGALKPEWLQAALADEDFHVRNQAIRLSESWLSRSPAVAEAFLRLADDSAVAYQLALSLGEWDDSRAGQALGRLALKAMSDAWMRAAIISSASHRPAEILRAVLTAQPSVNGRTVMIDQLISTAVGRNDPAEMREVIAAVMPTETSHIEDWQFAVLKTLLEALDRRHLLVANFETAEGGSAALTQRINAMFDAARKLAADNSAPEASRQTAIGLLGRGADNADENLQLVGTLLKPENSAGIQKAALEALKHSRSGKVPELLLANWKRQPPSIRATVLEILLSRDEFINRLLAAVEAGTIQVNEISPASRQRLLKHQNAEIQKRAAALLNAGASSRADVLAKYQGATTLKGDPAKGRMQFEKNCSTCHLLNGVGHSVGPNLAALSDKSPGDFLVAILDPNAAVEPRFVSYNIETRDDRSLSGIVSAETATTLTLVMPGGIQESILRSDISEIRATGLSLMPEGLEQALLPQDLADLIAYLKTGTAPQNASR